MLRFSPLTIGVIIAICVAGVIFSLPNLLSPAQLERLPNWFPRRHVTLGLDIQGGSSLLLRIDLDAAIKERTRDLAHEIQRSLHSEQVDFGQLVTDGSNVTVTLADPGQSSEALEILKKLGSSVITPDVEIKDNVAGRIEIELKEDATQTLRESAVDQSMEIVRRRINEVRTNTPTILRQGGDSILVQMPGEWEPDAIKKLVEQRAKLSFHLVDTETSFIQARSGNLPANSVLLPTEGAEGPSQIVVRKRVEVSSRDLIDARPTYDPQDQPVVSLTLNSAGARRLDDVIKDHVDDRLAIVLDERVIGTPQIKELIIDEKIIISGDFTFERATELAVLLRTGALPAPLTVIEMRTGGP